MAATRLVATIAMLAVSLSLLGLPTMAPSAAQAGQPIKGVSEMPSPEALNNKVLDRFKAEVEKASGRRIEVELYKGTVGPGKELMEGLVLARRKPRSL